MSVEPPRSWEALRMAHTHSHAGGSGHLHIPSSLRTALAASMVPVIVFVVFGLLVLWPRGQGPDLSSLFGKQHLVKGTVTAVSNAPCEGSTPDSGQFCQQVRIRVRGGPDPGH